jgi:hypothetical protein
LVWRLLLFTGGDMTHTKDEALFLALEALDAWLPTVPNLIEKKKAAITAIKQALAAPVQSCYCPNCEAMGKELAALKAQPAVPDAFGTREGEHPQYIEGWNDCRAEMLKGMK